MKPYACVQVERQQVSGGINMKFLDAHIANAYNNLTNIILSLTPHGARTEKAVLVSAHYDSLIGTVGMRPALLCHPHSARPRPYSAMLLTNPVLHICRGFGLRIAGRSYAGGRKGAAQQP